MNAEDTLVAIKDVEKTNEKGRKEGEWRGWKRDRSDRQNSDRGKKKDDKAPQTVNFTPLVVLVDRILAQIKDKHYLKWPRPLHLLPNFRYKKKYCYFHKDHGHYTEDCKDLKEQIKELIRRGKFQNFVKKGDSNKPRDNSRDKPEASPRDRPQATSSAECNRRNKDDHRRTIHGGFFRSLKKSY